MGVLDGGNAESGTEGGFDAERRRVLKVFGCAAAAVAVAPAVLRRRAWGAVAPPALEGETRVLGSTGIRVATVGMGAMITRHPDVIRYAVDHGVNYLDTADCYMGGENERIVGRAMRHEPDRGRHPQHPVDALRSIGIGAEDGDLEPVRERLARELARGLQLVPDVGVEINLRHLEPLQYPEPQRTLRTQRFSYSSLLRVLCVLRG